MQVTVEIPDEFASHLAPADRDPSRIALEAMAVDAYRDGRLTGYQLQKLLGIQTRYELDGFLKNHQVWLEYTIEDFEREQIVSEQLREKRKTELNEVARQD